MGKKSRTKGHGFERAIVSMVKLIWPDAARGRQYASSKECDVEGTPFRIECKAYKDWPDVFKALRQVQRDGDRYNDKRPVAVVFKKDRVAPLFLTPLVDMVKFVEENVFSPPEETPEEILGDE